MQRIEGAVGGFLSFSLLDEVYVGSPISARNTHPAVTGRPRPPQPRCTGYSIARRPLLTDSLFVMNINIGRRSPDA